jgi:hypothetical protein
MWGKSSGFYLRCKREYRKLLRRKKRMFLADLENTRVNDPAAFFRQLKSKSGACPIG